MRTLLEYGRWVRGGSIRRQRTGNGQKHDRWKTRQTQYREQEQAKRHQGRGGNEREPQRGLAETETDEQEDTKEDIDKTEKKACGTQGKYEAARTKLLWQNMSEED